MFLTPKNFGNTEDHTPIETQILNEQQERQQKEELNPKDDAESQMKFMERFDSTETLPAETEKQAAENILFEFHVLFA